jgi:hypothetical protein
LDQHYKYVSACAFSTPESRLFVTACRNTVSVWKLDIDSQPLAKAFQHTPVSEWSGELRRGASRTHSLKLSNDRSRVADPD